MFYVRQVAGVNQYRPVSPYMGTDWYEDGGWMLYTGALPQSRVTIEGGTVDAAGITRGGTIAELPASTPAPRVLSKLRLRDNLTALGLWDVLKAAIAADADVTERWALAQDVREDDADFVALKGRLTESFTAAGRDLDGFLDQCVLEA